VLEDAPVSIPRDIPQDNLISFRYPFTAISVSAVAVRRICITGLANRTNSRTAVWSNAGSRRTRSIDLDCLQTPPCCGSRNSASFRLPPTKTRMRLATNSFERNRRSVNRRVGQDTGKINTGAARRRSTGPAQTQRIRREWRSSTPATDGNPDHLHRQNALVQSYNLSHMSDGTSSNSASVNNGSGADRSGTTSTVALSGIFAIS